MVDEVVEDLEGVLEVCVTPTPGAGANLHDGMKRGVREGEQRLQGIQLTPFDVDLDERRRLDPGELDDVVQLHREREKQHTHTQHNTLM